MVNKEASDHLVILELLKGVAKYVLWQRIFASETCITTKINSKRLFLYIDISSEKKIVDSHYKILRSW